VKVFRLGGGTQEEGTAARDAGRRRGEGHDYEGEGT